MKSLKMKEDILNEDFFFKFGSMNMYRDNFNRGGGYDRPPREMHKVTCAECNVETEVPFKPDGSRPVYCRDCYQKRRPQRF